MNRNTKMPILRSNHTNGHSDMPGTMLSTNPGPRQPPRNSVLMNAEAVNMFTYSAIWKRAHLIEEYSVR